MPSTTTRSAPSTATSRGGATVLAGFLLLAGLAGCAPASGDTASNSGGGTTTVACPDEPSAAGTTPALVLLVGVHANAPAADVPAMLACDIRDTLQAGSPVAVVGLDGDPAVEDTIRFDSAAQNDAARSDDLTAAEKQVLSAVRGARASSDGSDLVAGMNVAADVAASLGSPEAHIVVIDSGLPDRGALNMTTSGMLAARPGEVAGFLADQHALGKLAGMRVDLVGIGYTSSPQEPLTPSMTDNLTAILRTSLDKAGATVRVRPAPRTGNAPDTTFTTIPAPLPATPTFTPSSTTVYDDTTALGFLPDTTTLRDPPAASRAVASLAAWLTADPQRRATITGTCASDGSPAGRARLSRDRADTVKALLTGLGVDPTQIATSGAGYIADPPDRRPDGTFDPAKAAKNRSVRITTTETP